MGLTAYVLFENYPDYYILEENSALTNGTTTDENQAITSENKPKSIEPNYRFSGLSQ